MKRRNVTSWAVIGSGLYAVLFLGVYLGCAYGDVSKDANASIRPDPSPAVARPSAKAHGDIAAPAIGVPVREASPLHLLAKRRHVLPKLDGDDPNDGEDLGAKIEIAADGPLAVDRHDPYDPKIVYPPVDMFTAPFDESDPFAAAPAAGPPAPVTAVPQRRHGKHDRHASATPTPHVLRPGTGI